MYFFLKIILLLLLFFSKIIITIGQTSKKRKNMHAKNTSNAKYRVLHDTH